MNLNFSRALFYTWDITTLLSKALKEALTVNVKNFEFIQGKITFENIGKTYETFEKKIQKEVKGKTKTV